MSNHSKAASKNIQDIYSQVQISRQRRGTSLYKSSARGESRVSKSQLKHELMKDTEINFYEGLATKKKYKDEDTVTMGHNHFE